MTEQENIGRVYEQAVTSSTVNAAGAVMNADTTTAGMSFVVDEDDMTSDLATKVPTQQSTKAYADVIDAKADALGAENVDGQMLIPILPGDADGGTYTYAVTSGALETLTRTAADAADSWWLAIPIENRSSASKGIKPTGLLANYTVDTADAEDVRFEIWKVTQGADGAARTAAVLFGDADGDYDAAHDTAAKRGDDTGAPELHLITVTDAGTPAYVATGETLLLRIYVDGAATSDFVLTSVILTYSETLVDLA